jgi:hypothetical protein
MSLWIVDDVSEEPASSMFNADTLSLWRRFFRNEENDLPDYTAKRPIRQ